MDSRVAVNLDNDSVIWKGAACLWMSMRNGMQCCHKIRKKRSWSWPWASLPFISFAFKDSSLGADALWARELLQSSARISVIDHLRTNYSFCRSGRRKSVWHWASSGLYREWTCSTTEECTWQVKLEDWISKQNTFEHVKWLCRQSSHISLFYLWMQPARPGEEQWMECISGSCATPCQVAAQLGNWWSGIIQTPHRAHCFVASWQHRFICMF